MKKGLISNIIIAIVIVYFMICYGEILIKNTYPSPEYHSWNIFATMALNEE